MMIFVVDILFGALLMFNLLKGFDTNAVPADIEIIGSDLECNLTRETVATTFDGFD